MFVPEVGLVALLEILHLCLSTHTTYTVLAVGFADPTALINSPMSGAALPAVNGLGGSFSLHRIPHFSTFWVCSGILHTDILRMEDFSSDRVDLWQNLSVPHNLGAVAPFLMYEHRDLNS